MTDLATPLREQGWKPESNVCAACGHDGGAHDLGNWCLTCPRPDDWDRTARSPTGAKHAAGWCYFASFTKEALWERAVARLAASGVWVGPAPHVPTSNELDDLMADISACGYASEAVEVVEAWTRKWWGVESAMTTAFADAPDVWSGDLPPGGYVCGACGMPTESEPCPDHQKAKIAKQEAP